MRIRWSPLALDRMEEITTFIARDKPGAALSWAQRTFDAVAALAETPRRGRVVPELGREEIRELLLGSFRVIYRLDDDGLSVLTVHHGRRLLDREAIPPERDS